MTRTPRAFLSLASAFALLATLTSPAGAQTATVFCSGQEATIVGTPGDDFLFGTDGDDVIAALQGHDLVFGGGGDDIICGGQGSDRLFGGLGFDTIFGAQGDDLIAGNWDTNTAETPQDLLDDTRGLRAFGGAGHDTIIGTNRWDRMQGGEGNDTLLGYDGRDRLRGGNGHDILVGHAGIDDLGAGGGADTISADSLDVNVRGAGGLDVCPSITNRATTWRGCEGSYQTLTTNPLLPRTSLPAQLIGGAANTYVYSGVVGANPRTNNSVVFLVDNPGGMSFGNASLQLQPATTANIVPVDIIHLQPVTQGEAKAIAQAWLIQEGLVGRWANALNPNVAYYDQAVAWGTRWLELNTAG